MYDDVYTTKHGFIIPDEHIPSEDDMARYSQGDETIVPVLAEGMTGYIVREVEWFLTRTPSAQPYREDCVSEGILALHEFTLRGLGEEYTPTKFLAFAKTNSLNQIRDWLREMSIAVTIPATSQRKLVGACLKQIRLDERVSQTDKDVVFDEVWFWEFMSNLDSFDCDLVQMKIDGKSNREIGRTLGVTHTTVQMHLDRLATLFGGEIHA